MLKVKLLLRPSAHSVTLSISANLVSCAHAEVCVCRHGMNDTGLKTVFGAIVVSRLAAYACPAWRGFITSDDIQRVAAFILRYKRRHYLHAFLPPKNSKSEVSQLLRQRVYI